MNDINQTIGQGEKHPHAIVVVDTTWLFKNFKKLFVDNKTENKTSGSWDSRSRSSSFSSFAGGSVSQKDDREISRQTAGIRAIFPFCFDTDTLCIDGKYHALTVVGLKCQNVRQGPQSFHYRTELLQGRKENMNLLT